MAKTIDLKIKFSYKKKFAFFPIKTIDDGIVFFKYYMKGNCCYGILDKNPLLFNCSVLWYVKLKLLGKI